MFEKEFVTHLPWKQLDVPRNPQMQEIAVLCHVTHLEQAQAITAQGGELEFLARPKLGKCGYVVDGRPRGESYRCDLKGAVPDRNTRYTAVGPGQSLLPPGHYSWWSVEPVRDSIYGWHKFSVAFEGILAAFQDSHRREGMMPQLVFRKAGTLRYRKKICYVILVHASTVDEQQIHHLPLLANGDEKFDFRHVLNDQGVVSQDFLGLDKQDRHYPRFNKEFTNDHWENIAFAFYCSSPLRIAEDHVHQSEIAHTRCMKRVNRRCPDENNH